MSQEQIVNTFTLDGDRFEIDTMPDKGKHILQLIADIRAKTELEIQTSELAIDRLTSQLKTMTEDFVKVEVKDPEPTPEAE
jgi:hypothetical protein